MTAAQINSALATRRVVRIAYSRDTDRYRVDVVLGANIQYTIAIGLADEVTAEAFATNAAQAFGLDVTRLDVA
jgi:CRISPR/Cas system-associated protein Cas7 (RAMP superfamily)